MTSPCPDQFAADLFGEPIAPKVRKGARCTRDPHMGPGSCWHFWDGCPDKVGDCFRRRAQAANEQGEEARQQFLKDVGLA